MWSFGFLIYGEEMCSRWENRPDGLGEGPSIQVLGSRLAIVESKKQGKQWNDAEVIAV